MSSGELISVLHRRVTLFFKGSQTPLPIDPFIQYFLSHRCRRSSWNHFWHFRCCAIIELHKKPYPIHRQFPFCHKMLLVEDMAPCRGDEAWESRGRQRLYQKCSTILERRSQRLQTKTMSNQTLPTRTGPARKVWPTPSYHESHRKTNTGRSCWVSGFKSRPNRIAYG